MAIHEYLSEVMKRRNIPVYELAIMARVNEFLLHKMLRGEHKFTSSMLERIALILKVNRSTIAAIKLLDEVDHDVLREAVLILNDPERLRVDDISELPERRLPVRRREVQKPDNLQIQVILRNSGERKAYHRLQRKFSRHRTMSY